MPKQPPNKRIDEFRARPLQWLVVHHLLDAGLVRELASALVSEISAGRLSLADLFEESPPAGDPAIADWFVATRDVRDDLALFLSRFVLGIIWRGDEAPFVAPDGLGPEEKAWAQALNAALSLCWMDLDSSPTIDSGARALSINDFASAIAEAHLAVREGTIARCLRRIDEATSEAPSLLSALFTKHVGDLFGDADCWDLALACYHRAGEKLSDDVDWDGSGSRTKQILEQSIAMATWHLDGPEQAAALLEAFVSRSTIAQSPLPGLNATFDLINAKIARGSFSNAWPDRRSATYIAPLLVQSHHLDNAMTYASTGRFREAHRWFWASLRRQTALGGTIASWHTKGHYGQALIDGVEARLGRERLADDFARGVRMLVESGRTELADATTWSDRLVETYVSPAVLDELRKTATRSPGIRVERELVATALRREWLLAIPRDREDVARDMLADLAASAQLGAHTGMSSTNTGGLALMSLKKVATERPEFRALLGPELVSLLDELRKRSGPLTVAEAMEVAAQFVDGVDVDTAERLCERVIDVIGELPPNAFWPVTRAASRLLGSDAASSFALRDGVFQRARSVALLKLALNSPSEQSSLLYLLRDVDPSVVREQIDTDGLGSIVEGIRERARDTSSSAATGNIHALLVAPKVSGEAGVADALDATARILGSAALALPSPSLQNGYEVLLLLARNGDRMAEDLGPNFDLHRRARELIEPLRKVWQAATSRPLIFAGFAIPPRSTPDRVTVHNWTFATLEFAQWLHAGTLLDEELEAAAANELLAEGMSIARAVQARASPTLDRRAVAMERADAFYAALGKRLVAIGSRSDADACDDLRTLLDRCLQLGPRGEDAALFLASRRTGVALDPAENAVIGYTAKLRRDAMLRLSLSPLLRSVIEQAESLS